MLTHDPNNYVHHEPYFRTRNTQSEAFQALETVYDKLVPSVPDGRVFGRNRTEYETNSNIVKVYMDDALDAMKAPTDDRYSQPPTFAHDGTGWVSYYNSQQPKSKGFIGSLSALFSGYDHQQSKRNHVECRMVGKYNDILFGMFEKPVVSIYHPPPVVYGELMPPLKDYKFVH